METQPSERLDSWKEIATYLNRSVRTVTRWEREEGLPVHRHLHSKAGSVYAYKAEIDAWWTSRGKQIVDARETATAPVTARRQWVPVVTAGVLLIAVIAWLAFLRPSRRVTVSTLTPLTTYPGVEGPPSLSPDGNQVAFERDGDIFVKQVDGEALVQLTRTKAAESSPAWSPDGRQIAYRTSNGIFVIFSLGGGERKVAGSRTPLLLKSMSWTPDGADLVVSDLTSTICASLFVVSVATGERRRLTSPPDPSIGDGWPAVSADGKLVAFARYSQDTSANVFVVPLAGGEPRQITKDRASIFGLAWTRDGDIVFSSTRNGSTRLWRVGVGSGSQPLLVDTAGDDARFPHISRGGARLAYQRYVDNVDIRRMEIGDAAGRGSAPFIASTKSDDHPSYSPDGTKIAFVSQRSGTPEIWVCASDGSNPVRLTSMGGPVVIAPRWSPDGRRIAFFAATGPAARYAVYVMNADGGRPVALSGPNASVEALPAWSRDGRIVYLTSARSGSLQIWKQPVAGGVAKQLTRNGGAEAAESPEGATVYYTKVPEIGPGLWSVSADGGPELRVLDRVRFGYWAIAPNGIYFVDFDVAADAPRPLKLFDLRTRQTTQIATLEKSVAWTNTPGFAISPDGRWLLYSSVESADADLMLVDNFR